MAAAGNNDESLPLAKFVENYDLPCTVMVTTGYSCGTSDEDDSLSQGEIITLHCVQQDQIVHANDPLGRDHVLPVIGNRKYQYLPSNPDHDNVMYDTVQELISDKDRPQKVRVTAAVDSGDDESTVYMDDILSIEKVEAKPSSRTGAVHPILIAMNSLGEALRLPTDTPGKFSAQLDVKWYSMTEIITKGNFPVRVVLVRSHPGYQHTGLEKFTITGTSLSKNVLVTVNKELLVMPLSTEIEVTPRDDLMDADTVFGGADGGDDGFDDMLPPPPMDDVLMMTGMAAGDDDLPPPPSGELPARKVSAPPPIKPRPKVTRKPSDRKSLLTDIETVRLRLGSVRTFGKSRRLSSDEDELMTTANPSPEKVREVFRSLHERTAKSVRLKEESDKWQSRCHRLNAHYQATRKQLTDLERAEEFWRFKATGGHDTDAATQKRCDEYKAMSEDVAPLVIAPSQAPAPVPPAASMATPVQKPLKDLTFSTLTVAQMLQLLDALNMSQYKDNFNQEQVDGGLLLELDEQSLESDVGIKSALHRKKIVRTMTGKGLSLEELLKA